MDARNNITGPLNPIKSIMCSIIYNTERNK